MGKMSQEDIDKHSALIAKIFGESDKTCPFCGEKDFDNVGLKWHLTSGHCDDFNNTECIG